MYTGNVFSSTAAASAPPGDGLSYAEAFPPLPTSESVGNGAETMLPASPTGAGRNQWGKKMSLRLSTTTQVCVLRAVKIVSLFPPRFYSLCVLLYGIHNK